MKKASLYFLLFFILNTEIFAQVPNWVVNENEYQYTMTIIAKLNVDGRQLINGNDRVGAFVGNSCRGVSGVTYISSKKNYYAFITLFSNQQGEVLTFKIFDQVTNKTTLVGKKIVFNINEHKGNLNQSYSIAEPALNNISEIITFNFKGIPSLTSIINTGSVKVNISESFSMTNLKPVFILSKGASIFENGVIQISGEFTKNFSSIVNYEVMSEDESTINNYKVYVSQIPDPTLYYKKDAVCYSRGSIKVVSKKEGSVVQLTSNGSAYATKIITNGEALFTELNPGSYIATLGTEFKIINIILKLK